jgi:hypothetical protein
MALLQSDLSFGLTLHGTFPDSFSSGEHQLYSIKASRSSYISCSYQQQDTGHGDSFQKLLFSLISAAWQVSTLLMQDNPTFDSRFVFVTFMPHLKP